MISTDEEPRFAALIANWNGADYIERCLGSVMAAARQCSHSVGVWVVDDASADDSPVIVSERFPSVHLIRRGANGGYARAVNAAMEQIKSPWVFLLNNDLALAPDFFERLIQTRAELDDPHLFAIGAKTLDWDAARPNHAGMNARWRGAMIVQEAFHADRTRRTDFIQAGACLIDHGRFKQLGGFREIFYPGYWEDYDLAWRALKLRWHNYYEPRAEAFHWGKRSMTPLLGRGGVARLIRRNHLLFNWINLSDRGLMSRHLAGLGRLMLGMDGSAPWSSALAGALVKLPEALRIRRRCNPSAVPDREILFPPSSTNG